MINKLKLYANLYVKILYVEPPARHLLKQNVISNVNQLNVQRYALKKLVKLKIVLVVTVFAKKQNAILFVK